jgi:hypothetical protein
MSNGYTVGKLHDDNTHEATDQTKHQRIEHDAYQTPIECVEKLLPFISFHGKTFFYEPCKGEGNIFNLILPLVDKAFYSEIQQDADYLKAELPSRTDLIITNPPFNQALEFLQKSLNEADTVIYLLRLNFFASQKRKVFWQNNKPTHVFVLSDRPSFTGNGTDRTDYMWCAWDRGNRIKTKEPFNWL